MASFSQRYGKKPMTKLIQRESMDEELRIRLWNAFLSTIWNKGNDPMQIRAIRLLIRDLWMDFFKVTFDFEPNVILPVSECMEYIKCKYFKYKWNQTYDFIEFVIKDYIPFIKDFKDLCNRYLEEENSAYRIVGKEVVEITDQNEIEAIESALKQPESPVTVHLKRALELLSDKKKPDYRNSIKESISAVEAYCMVIAEDDTITLGKALDKISDKIKLHLALKSGFKNIYGWTSDDGGIRHALTEEDSQPSYADAKFMIVACSAFVNYLTTKALENGR